MTDAKPSLTVEDPVPPEVLSQLKELEEHQVRLGINLLSLETEKIQILAANRRIEEQQNRLFEQLLIERGLAPGVSVTVDPVTGKITVG